MTKREVQGFNIAPMIRDAKRVFVAVHSRHDTHYVQITKAEARRLLEATGFSLVAIQHDLYIDAATD